MQKHFSDIEIWGNVYWFWWVLIDCLLIDGYKSSCVIFKKVTLFDWPKMAVHADQETAEAEGSGKASMQKTQASYNHLRRRSCADCENGRLPLQHWWVEKRHSLQSVWKPLKNQSECCMQHENSSRVRHKLKGYLRDLRTTWHHPAAWHHPGAMDTRIVI